jgi:hypothetical protein
MKRQSKITSAGYSGTPLARKFGIAPASRVCLLNAPADYKHLFDEFPDGVIFERQPSVRTDIAHVFVTKREELLAHLKSLRSKLRPDAAIWVSWPKKAAKVATTVTWHCLWASLISKSAR